MKYQYRLMVTPFDFFRLSMHRTYHSLPGVCNIVFTLAMFALTYRFWGETGDVLEALMVFGCMLFPVFQPIGVYLKSKAQVRLIPDDLTLGVDQYGVHIAVGDKKQNINFKKIKGIIKEYKMIIIFSDNNHGYILTDRVLGKEKEEFFEFVSSRVEQKK